MKRNSKHLYRDELKKMFILYSTSFIVISILSVILFVQIYTNQVIRNNNSQASNNIIKTLNDELKEYENALVRLTENEEFVTSALSRENYSHVYRMLYDIINKRQIKSMFYYVDTNGKTLITNNYINAPYDGSDIFFSGLFKQMNRNTGQVVYLNQKAQIDLIKRTVYSIGKSVEFEGEIVGYLVFDLLESEFSKIIYEKGIDVVVVTDQYNNVIVTTNSLILDEIGKFKVEKQGEEYIQVMDQTYYYDELQLLNDYIHVYTMTEMGLVRDLLTSSLVFMIVVLIIVTVIVVKISDYAAKKKTVSINNLIEAIRKVQKGDLKAFVPLGSTDEFQIIGEQFNGMLIKLNQLIEKNNELIERNRLSEVKQLESQFNPHFIFNTLETLKYMIHIDRNKASDIIMGFGVILRYSIDYESKDILLDQDLDYLNSYLMIQKYRYNKRLSYQFKIDANVKELIVPKLILQPIIENCINHGYKEKDTLRIDITIKRRNMILIAIVQDDGDGIDEETLEKIRKSLSNPEDNPGHIGVINVHRRIQLMYGEEYGLELESEIGIGTKVTIKLPAKETICLKF